YEILSRAHNDSASETDLLVYLHFDTTTDRCCYNLSNLNEVAVILPSDDSVPEEMHDIILCLREGQLDHIHEGNSAYLPLYYVLFFPYSELGWYSKLCQVIKLTDAVGNVANETINSNNLGYHIILPSMHIESSCHMFKIFQDSMSITCFYYYSNIFGTMIANSNWPEIINELLLNQTLADRPDLPTDIDHIVSTKFPCQDTDLLFFDTVLHCIVHGSCGAHNPKAPCIENGKCQKKYPKSFNDMTSMDLDSYPLYARRNDGCTFNIGFAIGKIYFASSSAREQFYIRLLFTVIRGPQSFDYLRVVNDIQYPTFKTSAMHSSSQLRVLFAVILTQCISTYPEKLWLNFYAKICDDLYHHLHQVYSIEEPTNKQ
ncbi:12934_t:CDS:2, partial [Cetraspora pellucida]